MQYERVKLRTTLKLLAWTIERIDQPFTVIRMPQRRTIRRAMSFKYLKFEMPIRCLKRKCGVGTCIYKPENQRL